MIGNRMVEAETNVDDLIFDIESAISKENMQNPLCPVSSLMQDLLNIYKGCHDLRALDLAREIALQSLGIKKD